MKEIILTQGKVALVDDEDFDFINQFKWYAAKQNPINNWYAFRLVYINNKPANIMMHREIIKTPDGMETDHINHNGLDNRRCNLRVCTNYQNQANRKKRMTQSTSKYKGVSWKKSEGRWIANIRINGVNKYLGSYKNEKEAALAYNKALNNSFGDFALLNDVTSED